MKIRFPVPRDMLAAAISAFSTIALSWSALFCLDKLLQLLEQDHLFHGIVQTCLLTLTTSLVAVVVRYFPSSIRKERVDALLHEVAKQTHRNVVESLMHILKDVMLHMNRIRLEIDSPDCDRDHLLYLIGKAIEEAELKQSILQAVPDPAKTDHYYRIRL